MDESIAKEQEPAVVKLWRLDKHHSALYLQGLRRSQVSRQSRSEEGSRVNVLLSCSQATMLC